MIPRQRKPTRLKDFDYSSARVYFITICTQDRQCVLSRITVGEGLAPPVLKLMPYGEIAEEQIFLLGSRFPFVVVEQYVIMPNHIHLLLRIRNQESMGSSTNSGEGPESTGGASPSPTVAVPAVIGAFKSITTHLCRTGPGLFQRSFHDHTIRDEQDYRRIWEYIDTNPLHWAEDCFYMMPGIVGEGLGPPA